MSQELTIPFIIQIKKICQYLSLNSISKNNIFKGHALDERAAKMIYVEGKSVELRYRQNPNDPSLRATANYLYSLLGRWAIEAQTILANLSVSPPVIVGPAGRTVNVGQSAVFSITVSSAVPYTVQWYDSNNNPIPGATSTSYTFINAQITDSGKTFYVKATNSAGTVTSVSAILTVNVQIVAFAWFGTDDPFPLLNSGTDNLAYQLSQNIVHNGNITFNYPLAAANNQYQVMKQPTTEKIKTSWFNTINNQGTLDPTGDQNWRASIVIGGFRYYITRQAIGLDSTVLSASFNG